MRDPNRIPLVLEHLKREWEKQPDLRLGQLLHYVYSNKYQHSSFHFDAFYVEDDVWLPKEGT